MKKFYSIDNTKRYIKLKSATGAPFCAAVILTGTLINANNANIIMGYGDGDIRNSARVIGGKESTTVWTISDNYFYTEITNKQYASVIIDNLAFTEIEVSFVDTL